MRTMMGRVVAVALLAAGLWCWGCDNPTTNTFNFTNNSSYVVNVQPDGGQTWGSFQLQPGQSHGVELGQFEMTISYRYSPSNHVQANNNGDTTITFTNK